MRDDLFISLKNLERAELSDVEIVIILALNGLIVGDLKENYINYSTLSFSIYGRIVSQSEKETIKRYFKKLLNKDIIKKSLLIDSNTYVCNVEEIFVNMEQTTEISKEFYICITKSELHKIMNISDNVDHFKMVRLFLWYINSLHKGNKVADEYKAKIGFMPQSYLASAANMNIKTLYKYNNILVKQKLLYIINHKVKYDTDNMSNGIHIPLGTNNTYSRYIDRELCDEYASIFKEGCYDNKKNELRKFKQSNSQKLKQYNLGKDYPLSELIEMHSYINLYNNEIEKGIKNGNKLDDTLIKKDIEKLKKQDKTLNNQSTLNNEYCKDLLDEKLLSNNNFLDDIFEDLLD